MLFPDYGNGSERLNSTQSLLPYHSHIDTDTTLDVLNALKERAEDGEQVASEDLARAISFIFEHADELGVSTRDYSVWGGSAGARMAADMGSYGPAGFGGDDLPRPAAVIMQYTSRSDYTRDDPPTYAVVGERDGIAPWRTMRQRIDGLSAAGTDTEFHHYPNLGHGFGLGIGTSAEGWVDGATAFWQRHIVGWNP